MKGMRVQSIIRELRGEKIDIIEYSEDPVVFATHALSPAKISRVSITNLQDRHMEVIVDDTQLSLAIGKKGQNVRLAAKLLGWKIDIKSEEEKRQEVESQMAALVNTTAAPVSALMEYGLPEFLVHRLMDGGVNTVEVLGNMTPEQLEDLPGIDAEQVEQLRDAVIGYYGQYDQTEMVEEGTEELEQQPLADYGESAETVGAEGPAGQREQLKEAKSEHADEPVSAEGSTEEHAEVSAIQADESARLNDADQAG